MANLQQNPQRRPVVSSKLPSLLKQGCMFLLRVGGAESECDKEERWLLDDETWSMVC